MRSIRGALLVFGAALSLAGGVDAQTGAGSAPRASSAAIPRQPQPVPLEVTGLLKHADALMGTTVTVTGRAHRILHDDVFLLAPASGDDLPVVPVIATGTRSIPTGIITVSGRLERLDAAALELRYGREGRFDAFDGSPAIVVPPAAGEERDQVESPVGTSGSVPVSTNVTVGLVTTAPGLFYGQQVRVDRARVVVGLGSRIFRVRDMGRRGEEEDEILVMTPAPFEVPPEGTMLVVEGELRQFLPDRLREELPWFNDAVAGLDLEPLTGKPVVIATAVRLPSGGELLKVKQ